MRLLYVSTLWYRVYRQYILIENNNGKIYHQISRIGHNSLLKRKSLLRLASTIKTLLVFFYGLLVGSNFRLLASETWATHYVYTMLLFNTLCSERNLGAVVARAKVRLGLTKKCMMR